MEKPPHLHGHVDALLVCPPLQHSGREDTGGPVVQFARLEQFVLADVFVSIHRMVRDVLQQVLVQRLGRTKQNQDYVNRQRRKNLFRETG